MRVYIGLVITTLFTVTAVAGKDCAELLKLKNKDLSKQTTRRMASVDGEKKASDITKDSLKSYPLEKLKVIASDLAMSLKRVPGAGEFTKSETKKYIQSETNKDEMMAFVLYLDTAVTAKITFKQLDTFVAMMQTKGYKWKSAHENCIEGDPTNTHLMALMDSSDRPAKSKGSKKP